MEDRYMYEDMSKILKDRQIGDFKLSHFTISNHDGYAMCHGIAPGDYVDYYTAKDWMIGNSKMQDWKAAVRNWERNQAKKNAKQKSKVANLARLECDRDYDFGALERQLFEKQMTG